jgi:hypothetical protein
MSEPLREWKKRVLQALRQVSQSGEFSFADFAMAVGGDGYLQPGPAQDRLRRFITNHSPRLIRPVRRGLYVAGAELHADEALGVSVALAEELDGAFDAAGGVLPLHQVLMAVGREDEGERFVRLQLEQSPRFEAGTPFEGYRRVWRLIEPERLKLPLPGALLRFELLMTADGMARGGRLPDRGHVDLAGPLIRFRRRINEALGDALQIAGASADDLAEDDELTLACERCWGRAVGDVSTWWAELLSEADGDAKIAASVGLGRLVDGTAEVDLLGAATVTWWRSLAATLGLNAALLSRAAKVASPNSLGF